MELHFKDQALRNFLTEVAAAWSDLRPASAAAFKQIVADENKALIKPSAMSAAGHMMNFCKIPQDLYSFIKREYRRRFEPVDFFADPKNFYLLCEIWSDARVRRKPTQYLRVKDSQPTL